VACVWRRDPERREHTRRVLPDACVDIVWIQGAPLIVAGPATGPVVATVPAGAAAAGVRFRVGVAGAALGLPASELLDRSVSLEDVWGREAAARIAERVEGAAGPGGQIAALAAAVGDFLPPPEALDRLVRAAAAGVAPPEARVETLSRRVGLGERQLRRRFADAVGYGPKTLQRVLRFQRFLTLAGADAAPGERPDLARLALDAGYADQAHLTRECRRLAGLPPAALLATGAGPAGERSDSFKTEAPAPATIAA
jgi:AraC-like DNA-binding protein